MKMKVLLSGIVLAMMSSVAFACNDGGCDAEGGHMWIYQGGEAHAWTNRDDGQTSAGVMGTHSYTRDFGDGDFMNMMGTFGAFDEGNGYAGAGGEVSGWGDWGSNVWW